MKTLLTFVFVGCCAACFGQCNTYLGLTTGSQWLDVHLQDTGNEVTVGSPPFTYAGLQVGFALRPKLALETGIMAVDYYQSYSFGHFPQLGSEGTKRMNIPLAGVWNPFTVSLFKFLKVRGLLQAGVNNVFLLRRESAGGAIGDVATSEGPLQYRTQTHHQGARYFLRPFGGAQLELLLADRFGLWAGGSYVLGGREIAKTSIDYSLNGASHNATLAANGGGRVFLVGIRLYFGEKTQE